MEAIEELRAKAIASMASAARVKSPNRDSAPSLSNPSPSAAGIVSITSPANPNSPAAAGLVSIPSPANPNSPAAAGLVSIPSPANPSSPAADAAAEAANPNSPAVVEDVDINSPDTGEKGETFPMLSPSAVGVKTAGSENMDEPVPTEVSPRVTEVKDTSTPFREEGEVSSGGEELPTELPTCSSVPSNCKTMDGPIDIAQSDVAAQTMKAALISIGSCPTNMQPPVSVTRNHSKHLGVKQVPLKSRNGRARSWLGKGSSDNLVIRFSNDDSESDSEDSNLENIVRKRTHRETTYESSLTSTKTHQRALRRPLTNRTKLLANKSATCTTDGRGSSCGKKVASSAEVGPQNQRHTSATKPSLNQQPSPRQEHEHVQDKKLESLRYQIAAKENALKLSNKPMIQSKERPADGGRQTAGIRRPASVTTCGVTPQEQGMKRLKRDGHPKSTLPDDQLQKREPSARYTSELYKGTHALNFHEAETNVTVRTEPKSDRPHAEANRDRSRLSDALHNLTKDDDSLAHSISGARHNLEVHARPKNTFSAAISCDSHPFGMRTNPADHTHVQDETLSLTRMKDNADDRALCQVDTPPHRNLENVPAIGSMDLESLMKLEELQDKNLEQAQELRRRCEFEERRALKAYRDAQRALIDANERCTRLYRKRELFSAQLRTLAMEASSYWRPSNWQQQETVLDTSKGPLSPLASLGHPMLANEVLDNPGCDYNDQCPDGLDQQITRRLFNHFVDPDVGRSAPTAAADDLEHANFHFDNSESDVNGQTGGGSPEVTAEAERSCGTSQDYDLLEATLRSTLVARLSARIPSKTDDAINAEGIGDKGDITGEKEKGSSSLGRRLAEIEGEQTLDMEGYQVPGRSIDELSEHIHVESQDNALCLAEEASRNIFLAEKDSSPMTLCCSPETSFSLLPSSNLQLVSRHAIFLPPGSSNSSCTSNERGYTARSTTAEISDNVLDIIGDCTKEIVSKFPGTAEMESSTCEVAIDPFRPFCMFELRGKCNNEECPWQHIENCTSGDVKCNNNHVTTSSGGWVSNSLTCGDSNLQSPCHQNLQIPSYQRGSDLVNVDSGLRGPVLARSNLQYWQRRSQVSDDYTRNGHFVCFRNRDGSVEQSKESLPDTEQSLEMALDLCEKDYESNRKKALILLSRAMEKDPTSVVSWIIYLHLYYGKETQIGTDDMFLPAVQRNGGSYDLWLMYINSREQLVDRLEAYDFALTTFCQTRDTCDKDSRYTSACMLDIFLQMVDFMCMSGNTEKAVSRFYQLVPTIQFERSGDTLFSRVQSHLIVSDKCIFWFCCIYVVIYGKVPERVVQKFEFEKDPPFNIDWPHVDLPSERKEMALELLNVSLDSVALDASVDSQRREQTEVRSLQFLATCHVRCVAALEGLRSSADLLVKYVRLYPSCIELVLMSARLQNCVENELCQGFEEALYNWPTDRPGVQCLWNQYAEHVLENKGYECAVKLLSRWFEDYWKGKDPCRKNTDDMEDLSGSTSELPSFVQSVLSSHYPTADDTFGFLNLFLYRMLQKNLSEARVAIDKALELANLFDYEHCVREHAAFIFRNKSELGNSCGFICSLLTGYFGDSRASSSSETLSRRYYPTIKKPRIRKFIDDILGTASRDFSIMNSIVEACYGSSLIPEEIAKQEELVDIVELLMERTPANYELALSVFSYICTNFSHTGVRFWASSIFMNSILLAVPVAPERVWLEGALLVKKSGNVSISVMFHQKALSIYPFSFKLWESYLDLSRDSGNTDGIVEAARERGVELALNFD